jgi:hypothetical protein
LLNEVHVHKSRRLEVQSIEFAGTGEHMETKMTRHQVPRGAMPDAEAFNKMYLIKHVTRLRATYQIRLLAFLAVDKGKQLILRVPEACVFDESLNDLMGKCRKAVSRENY